MCQCKICLTFKAMHFRKVIAIAKQNSSTRKSKVTKKYLLRSQTLGVQKFNHRPLAQRFRADKMHHPRSHTHTAITQTALIALVVHKLDHLTLAQRLRMYLPWNQTRTAITALEAHKVDHLTLAQRFRAAKMHPPRNHILTAITPTAITAPAVHKGLQETRGARLSSILNDGVYTQRYQ